METAGIPDLLNNNQLRRRLGFVQQEITRSGQEVSTGVHADLRNAVQGNPQRLFVLERQIALNETFSVNIQQANSRAILTQESLALLQRSSEEVGLALIGAVERNDAFSAGFEGQRGRPAFEEAVAALNTRFGDRHLFSGAASDNRAVASADAILAEIQALTAAETDPLAAIAAVENYFDDPAGFDTTGYLGSTTDVPSAEIEEGVRVDFAVRADNANIKEVLKGLALAVVGAEEGFFAGSRDAQNIVLREAAETSLAATNGIIQERATLGFAEQQIEEAEVRNSAETTVLNDALQSIIGRDQFEAAAEFNALDVQLQAIFSVTARLAQLNFASFI